MGKKKHNKIVETEKLGSITTTTTIITKEDDGLDAILNNNDEEKEIVEASPVVVLPKDREVIGDITSKEILVIDRINGFSYVKEGNLRKNYNSVQYKLNNPYNATSAMVSADGIDIGILAVEYLGKEKHQMSDIELDEMEEEKFRKESFVVKG